MSLGLVERLSSSNLLGSSRITLNKMYIMYLVGVVMRARAVEHDEEHVALRCCTVTKEGQHDKQQ